MEKNNDFYKCGEISTSIQIGKTIFAFNCIFCANISLKLEEFTSHIEKNHYSELYGCEDTTEENDCEELLEYSETTEEYLVEKLNNSNLESIDLELSGHQLNTESAEAVTIFDNDPLSEAAIGLNLDVLQERTINDLVTAKIKDDEIYSILKELQGINDDDNSALESDFEMENNVDKDDDVIDNDIANMDLLITLIEEYKKNHTLWEPWDTNNQNRRNQEEAIKMIRDTVNNKLNVSLSMQEVSQKIKEIHAKFCNELQNQKLAAAEGEVYSSRSIYFKDLDFLKSVRMFKPDNDTKKKLSNFASIQQKPRSGYYSSSTRAVERPALPLLHLTDAQNLKLIEMYRSFPCLWDTRHISFRSREKRTEAIKKIMEYMRKHMQLKLTQNELLTKLDRIRYACTQDKHRKLECKRLQTEFKPLNKYFEQISFLVDHVGPFKCDVCEKTFNSPDQYRQHKSNHDGSMPFRCPICNRGFMQSGNCTVHVRRHTRDYPFACKICSKRFATTTDVNVHMRSHTGEKPYFCEVCGQSFRTYSLFNTHRRRHDKRPNHFCTICDKAFYENNKLTDHMKAHLNIRDKVCNVCGKGFTCSKYLRQHRQIHAEKKKYVCKICKKDFAQYAGLSGHMKSHGTTITGASGGGGIILEDQH